MNPLRFLSAFLISSCAVVAVASAATDAGKVYELRTYTAAPGKMENLLARFRDHTLKFFEKHGMTNVGYWVLADAKEGDDQKIVYLLEHPSREVARGSWRTFMADPGWQEAAKKSEEGGRIVSKVESLFLTSTDFAKTMSAGSKAGGSARVFELRTYTTPEGKLSELDARFRNHTLGFFEKYGMTSLGYFHPIDANKGAATTLVYFLAYPSREAATAAWQKFRADPGWVKAKADSEKNGPLTTKVESVFLRPTDFSPIK